MKKSQENNGSSCRLNKVGGQAVIEGVMMKAGARTVTTCRKEDGSIVVYDGEFVSIRKKYKVLNLPIIRGVVNFIEMLILSFKTLGASADAMDLDEGKDSKTVTTVTMIVALILGVALALGLFLFLPILTADLIDLLFGGRLGVYRAIVEGVMKSVIFVAYLWLVSLMKDIKRTFMYHGAEHKTIACFEAGLELTPENAMKCKRFHPRCGTSFMFFMILLGIIAGFFLRFLLDDAPSWVYYLVRLAVLPLLMGIGYEFIMFAGKHDNKFTRALSAPGLWVQRITTKEPTEDMLEIAIISTKCALRDEFPEFMEFYNERPWEPKVEPSEGDPVEASSDNEGAPTEGAKDDGYEAAVNAVTDGAKDESCEAAVNAPTESAADESYEAAVNAVTDGAKDESCETYGCDTASEEQK